MCMDPGEIPAKDISFVKQLIEKNEDLTKYCYKCFIKKERDTIHCIICNKCFSNFDHHCYCINNCIAINNYSLFILFLFEIVILLLFILLMSILGLIAAIKDKNDIIKNIYKVDFLNFIFDNNYTWTKDFHIGANIFLIILALFFLIPVAILMVLHMRRNCTEFKEKSINNFSNNKLFDDKESSITNDE